MESTGLAGRIHMTDVVGKSLGDLFMVEKRGAIQIKGNGELHPWFLNGWKEDGRLIQPLPESRTSLFPKEKNGQLT